MINRDLYDMIFKRKSFHLFRNTGDKTISPREKENIKRAYNSFTPLCPDIKTDIEIVPESKTSCGRGRQYCILLYSEEKDNYLRNIGYLGEQLDLYLVSQNIGTLWYGIGKPEKRSRDGLGFVIMLAAAKVDDDKKFRKDMYKSKRKPVCEIWQGEAIDGVTDIARYAPSACNTQPWIAERKGPVLNVYRYKKPGKRGIMPADKVSYYNRIDMGIFLCFLDLCLEHTGHRFERICFADDGSDNEKTITATYSLH